MGRLKIYSCSIKIYKLSKKNHSPYLFRSYFNYFPKNSCLLYERENPAFLTMAFMQRGGDSLEADHTRARDCMEEIPQLLYKGYRW